MSEWISVDDRLPESGNDVLTTDGYDYCISYFSIDEKEWFAMYDGSVVLENGNKAIPGVTHWKPLRVLPQ